MVLLPRTDRRVHPPSRPRFLDPFDQLHLKCQNRSDNASGDASLVPAQQDRTCNRCWRYRGRLSRWSVCHWQMARSASTHGRGEGLRGEVRLPESDLSLEFSSNRHHSIRRRFTQNQQDCSFTVLALLPTVREEIIGAFPVEDISDELQKQRAERLARTSAGGVSDATSTDIPSGAPSVTEDDRASLASMSLSGGSYLHASQMADSTIPAASRPRKTKVQLWYDMKIGCEYCNHCSRAKLADTS